MRIEELLNRDDISPEAAALLKEELEKIRLDHKQQSERQELLHNASRIFNNSLNLDSTLNSVLEEIRSLMGIVGGSIWLKNSREQLICRLACGLGANLILGWQLDKEVGLAGWVAEHNSSLIVNDTDKDGRHFEGVNEATHLGIRSIITVPLHCRGSITGVLQIVDDRPNRFSEEDLEILEPLAVSAALALDNARLFSEAQKELLERKILEQDLQQSNNEKDKLFSIIAHDLRNPFNAIMNFADIMIAENSPFSEKQIRTLCGQFHKTTRNVVTLLENLLLWSRNQMDRIDFLPSEFALSALVEEIRQLYIQQYQQKQITLINNIPPRTLIKTDRNLIQVILRNLISNAIKFTPENGRIIVDIRNGKDASHIMVMDNGPGIDLSIIRKLKNNEEPLSRPGTANEKGTGLGLMLCRDMAKNAGGASLRKTIQPEPSSGYPSPSPLFFTVLHQDNTPFPPAFSIFNTEII